MAILTNKGFNVTTEDRSGSLLTEFKFESGVPKNMMACHTAKIDRYFIRIYIILQTLIQRRSVMKSYEELKTEMKTIQQQMIEAKKNERANALKEVKRLCKEFGFTAGMLKGSLAEGRKKK